MLLCFSCLTVFGVRCLNKDLSIPSGKTLKDVLDGTRKQLYAQGVTTVDATESVEQQQEEANDEDEKAAASSSSECPYKYLPLRKLCFAVVSPEVACQNGLPVVYLDFQPSWRAPASIMTP